MDPFSGHVTPAGDDEHGKPTEIIHLVGDDNELMEYIRTICRTRTQVRIARNPVEADIYVHAGKITWERIETGNHRLDGLLIHIYGDEPHDPAQCRRCASNPARGPFPHCRSALGFWGGACSNCVWRGRGEHCDLEDSDEADNDHSGEDGAEDAEAEEDVSEDSDEEVEEDSDDKEDEFDGAVVGRMDSDSDEE